MSLSEKLSDISTRFETGVSRDPKIGLEISENLKNFRRRLDTSNDYLGNCANVKSNMKAVIEYLAPRAQREVENVYNALEISGIWDTTSEQLYQETKNTLTPEAVINNSIDSMLLGCDCRHSSIPHKLRTVGTVKVEMTKSKRVW